MPDAPDPPPEPRTDAPTDAPTGAPLGTPPGAPPPPEIVLPRGCNPLTFGVVMATLEMALILWLWSRCS